MITMKLVTSVFHLKLELDSMRSCVKMASELSLSEEQLKSLNEATIGVKDKYNEACQKIIKRMPVNSSLVKLQGDWIGIRWKNGSVHGLYIKPILPKDLYLLEREVKQSRDFTSSELDTILPSIADRTEVLLYKEKIANRAKSIIQERFGDIIAVAPQGDHPSIKVSVHAGVRWVQRRMGISNESKAEEYRKANRTEIEEAIVEQFNNSAKLVWTDMDSVGYWFDDENIMYVVDLGSETTIITLYEEDFGWDKEENRWLVLRQLSKLHELIDKLKEVEDDTRGILENNSKSIAEIDDSMRDLESRLAVLSAQKQSLLANNNEMSKIAAFKKQEYDREFNKLFKRWEGTIV